MRLQPRQLLDGPIRENHANRRDSVESSLMAVLSNEQEKRAMVLDHPKNIGEAKLFSVQTKDFHCGNMPDDVWLLWLLGEFTFFESTPSSFVLLTKRPSRIQLITQMVANDLVDHPVSY